MDSPSIGRIVVYKPPR